MQLFTVGQPNTVGFDLATADGYPITTGEATFYLKAVAGEHAGQWWNGTGWSETESAAAVIAAASGHEGRGHWSCTIGAGAWIQGARYKLYAVHEAEGQINYREEMVEEWSAALATMPSDVADELMSRLTAIQQAMGAIPAPGYATVQKTSILSFAARAWQKTGGFDPDALDDAIAATLTDLNGSDLLRRTETAISLQTGDGTLSFPPHYKSLIAITLTDGAGKSYPPLSELPGDLHYLRHLTASSGQPKYFVDDGQCVHLYPSCGADYAVTVDYWWNHPPTPDDLAYPVRFQHLLNLGTVYWEAMLRRNGEYINHWGPVYFGERVAKERATAPVFRGVA